MSGSQFRVEYEPDLGPSRKPPKRTRSEPRSPLGRLTKVGLFLLTVATALVLPFILLVRLSVFLYAVRGFGNWTSLSMSALAVFSLLLAYVVLLRLRYQRTVTVPKVVRRGLLVAVVAYLGYALFYLSAANAKTSEIRSAYVALSPILRVATGTVLLVDREGVITDVGRSREDYIAWGLPVNEASLHFEQDDGFVHAVDLRTRDRPEWRSRATQWYYTVMGFRTLRHVGTADHLHVSLPAR